MARHAADGSTPDSMDDPDPAVRRAAAEGAGLYPTARARERLRHTAAGDPDASVRRAAVEALSRFP